MDSENTVFISCYYLTFVLSVSYDDHLKQGGAMLNDSLFAIIVFLVLKFFDN